MMSTEMRVRQFTPNDETAVLELWQKCGLISPENNPEYDINRKLEVNPELFLVGTVDGRVIANINSIVTHKTAITYGRSEVFLNAFFKENVESIKATQKTAAISKTAGAIPASLVNDFPANQSLVIAS